MGIRMMAPYKIGKWWSGNGMLIAMQSRDKADDFMIFRLTAKVGIRLSDE